MFKPQATIGDFKKFLTSPELIVVGSAVLLTPLLQASVESIINRFAILQAHTTIALLLAGFVVFILASKLSGFLKQIALGFAAGLAITAIAPLIPTGAES